MYYTTTTDKRFDDASRALEAAVKAHGFGVLHVHDLGETLRAKGIDFPEQCRVFEVCNPQEAARVLAADMRLNMLLPCRISVYTQGGRTHLGLVRPAQMLAAMSDDASLAETAERVEAATIRMVDEAAA